MKGLVGPDLVGLYSEVRRLPALMTTSKICSGTLQLVMPLTIVGTSNLSWHVFHESFSDQQAAKAGKR